MQDANSTGPASSAISSSVAHTQANVVPGTSKTSAATSVSTPASMQIDAAKLEAIRKATLNSYKNKFLNLRDKFDKVNAVCYHFNAVRPILRRPND